MVRLVGGLIGVAIFVPGFVVSPAFAIESFDDPEADVRQSILRVRNSPFLPHRDEVRGFVYDVDTHALQEVAANA